MKKVVTRVYPSTKEWITSRQQMSDRERAHFAADRVRRYIDCWEVLRKAEGAWVSITTVISLLFLLGVTNLKIAALKISSRSARRTFHHLEASGRIEVQWSRGGRKGKQGGGPSQARVTPKEQKP